MYTFSWSSNTCSNYTTEVSCNDLWILISDINIYLFYKITKIGFETRNKEFYAEFKIIIWWHDRKHGKRW